MTGSWIRFAVVAGLLLLGMFFEMLAVFGVNKFRKALNRMHAAAIGDTLGILFIFLGLMVMRGLTMDSLKLFLVILFFWLASPVSGHMISRLEAMTNEDLGEIEVIRLGEKPEADDGGAGSQEAENAQAGKDAAGKASAKDAQAGAGSPKPGNAAGKGRKSAAKRSAGQGRGKGSADDEGV